MACTCRVPAVDPRCTWPGNVQARAGIVGAGSTWRIVKASWRYLAIFRLAGDWGDQDRPACGGDDPGDLAGRYCCENPAPHAAIHRLRLLAVPGDDEVVVRTYRVMVIGSPR